ncbi:MAG: excinuclease ABC subunit UvrB [Puniceicoccales bacterium]|jgi:excinuclease ABC subunit B|nr:excinuclease ABC subunit UvrB [Puniceicoccales bacterium]
MDEENNAPAPKPDPHEQFRLVADYAPTGDQPQAIAQLEASFRAGNKHQTLLGVTGSGKTFTMASLIQRLQRPTLIISHNKTLAAQLYSEFKNFFPHNAVEYFISYYDYYQPEAYIPQTDTYIEKDSAINDDIERLRIAASSALLSRRDVIVVASVSCIYGLGSPEDFKDMAIHLAPGLRMSRDTLLEKLVTNLYQRDELKLERCNFRVRGEVVDVFPAYKENALRIEFWGDEIEGLRELDPLTGRVGERLARFDLYPATQYVVSPARIAQARDAIRAELEERVAHFERAGRLLEAQRIRMRTEYDLEMLQETGICQGVENYSLHIAGRRPGSRPCCLLDFFPDDFLTFIDESHVTVPQISGMSHGDRSRKERLIEFGFRLPSALENRPLRPEEFQAATGQTLYVSATPAPYEINISATVAEQIIRPTGLLDPEMCVRPIAGQVEDLIAEAKAAAEAGERTLVTTLTKRMSEDLAEHMRERGLRVEYLHSDIDAIERVEILRRLREGRFDVLIGVNLLREGLDLPEVALVAILDADKEGFLRSQTSIIQTAGRAARHERGRVILYADVMTESLARAQAITKIRRERQIAYNLEHGITPRSVIRPVQASLTPGMADAPSAGDTLASTLLAEHKETADILAELETEMLSAADQLEFERAALLRDQIAILRGGAANTGKDAKRPAQTTYKPSRRKRR